MISLSTAFESFIVEKGEASVDATMIVSFLSAMPDEYDVSKIGG